MEIFITCWHTPKYIKYNFKLIVVSTITITVTLVPLTIFRGVLTLLQTGGVDMQTPFRAEIKYLL